MFCQFKLYCSDQSFIEVNIVAIALMHFESALFGCLSGKSSLLRTELDACLKQSSKWMGSGHAALHPQHPSFMQGGMVRGKSSLWKSDFTSWNKKGWTVHLSGLNGAVPGKRQRPKRFQYHIIQE